MHVPVYVPPRDVELIEWIQRLKRDDVKVSAAIRRILHAHIRAEEKLTAETIADVVVARMREEGLVLSVGVTPDDQVDLIQGVLEAAAEEFTFIGGK